MNRIIIKNSMKTLFAVVMAVFTFSGVAWAQAWNHNPDDSKIGPFYWGSVTPSYATCGDKNTGEVGMKQSPIDIATDKVVPASFSKLLFKYNQTPLIIENTGHYVEVPYDPNSNSYLYAGSQPTDVYKLTQFHFHAPSEHTINGHPYDAELHLVHTNAIGEIAVIGVLLSSSAKGLEIFDTIMATALLTSTTEEPEIDLSPKEVNVFDLLPFSKGFYRYAGSLTTPACSESVQWFLMRDPVLITPGALVNLHTVISEFPNYGGYANNNRPTADQNGRTVLKSIRNDD